MQATFVYAGKLVVVECAACHMHFGVPTEFDAGRLRSRRAFYCPDGHTQSYTGPTKEQELRRELDDERAATEYWREEQQRTARQHAATKGQLTKTKKRIGNGTCPCCNRHFVNVERHMVSKHPDFREPERNGQ